MVFKVRYPLIYKYSIIYIRFQFSVTIVTITETIYMFLLYDIYATYIHVCSTYMYVLFFCKTLNLRR